MTKKDITQVKLYYRNFETVVDKYVTEGEELHHHDMYQIEFIASGTGVHYLNSKEYPIERGLMYAVRLRDHHSFKATSPVTVYRITMPMKCMPERMSYGMLKSKTDIVTRLDEEQARHIENLFLMLESRPKALLNFEINIQEWLINIILSVFQEQAYKNPEDIFVSDETKVEKVMLYIEDNFRQKLSIADVAKQFRMNPNYLNRIFKEQKGITLYAAIKNCRLNYAKKLLTETNLSVAEVCKSCGYSGDANFLRDFKKETELSPLKYRKAQRGK